MTERTKIVIENRPAAALFATMGDEFQALVADIAKNGQQDPILLQGPAARWPNRLKACNELEIEPQIMEWTGECGTPEAFIATRNLLRRHLTASQRAMIAAKLANLANGGVRMNAQPVNGEEKTEKPGLTDGPSTSWPPGRAR